MVLPCWCAPIRVFVHAGVGLFVQCKSSTHHCWRGQSTSSYSALQLCTTPAFWTVLPMLAAPTLSSSLIIIIITPSSSHPHHHHTPTHHHHHTLIITPSSSSHTHTSSSSHHTLITPTHHHHHIHVRSITIS